MPGRPPLTREVQVSKKLSWLLRHGAEKEGLQLQSGGFLNVRDVLQNRNIKSFKVTLDELRTIVEENDKKRFTLMPVGAAEVGGEAQNEAAKVASDKPQEWLIRANQGHSVEVEDEGLLQPITAENVPEVAVHGTTHAAWLLIVATGGLKSMTRNHVHFAKGLPAGFKSVIEGDVNAVDAAEAAPVISGMRKSSTVLMFLEVAKAMEAGLKLAVSDNGVVLTKGNAEGLVPLKLFKRVEDRTGEGVLLEDGKVVKEAPATWAGKSKGKG
ncbi:tRNA 2'-phosphotransferase [Recurvomyces mirabilis]|uniref:2'-phosphotransferase n=1 Tax=Recurvomyces mirabilis TaxID=574656 RepID=A0AAE0WNA1_9PEZI|nr:tRNA 2'-phosphotransferase [Recurvomyces mirabilis]KAK5152606.1 tRNA 2'-phosphotransferase [Recurvomyces mirabilis]